MLLYKKRKVCVIKFKIKTHYCTRYKVYKILIVEDDISIHNLIKEVLENEHYIVLNAYSGTEALLILEKERPDLILLDLMLPRNKW